MHSFVFSCISGLALYFGLFPIGPANVILASADEAIRARKFHWCFCERNRLGPQHCHTLANQLGSFDRDYLATRDIEIEIHNLSQLPARIAIDFYFVGRPQRLPTPDKLFSKHSFIVNVAASDQEQLSLRSDASADVGTTVRNSIVTGKRPSLSRRIPRVLSPECLQRGIVAAKNVAFSFSNVGYRFRKQAPRSQIAFTIATVLPHYARCARALYSAARHGS